MPAKTAARLPGRFVRLLRSPRFEVAMGAVTCPPEMFPNFGRVCFSRGRTNETQQVQR